MMFITLHSQFTEPFLVNVEHIIKCVPREKGTDVYLAHSPVITVTETIEDITKLFREAYIYVKK